jgi:GT2 family glycosyltransferase
MNGPKLSAVVIAWNGMKFMPDCLRTLQEDLEGISHEIIVVDNGSTDGSAEFVTKECPSVRLIRHSANLGFAKAVNAGMRASSGKYVLLLNQDIRIRRGATGSLLARIESDRSIGVIGPKFVGFDGKTQQSARAFPSMRHVWYDALLLSRLFRKHREFGAWRMGWFDHEHELEVDQPMGAALLMRREVIDKLGEFDELFPIFFNDVDYCRRVKEAGYKLLYYPDAVIEHYVGGSTRKHPVRMKWESHRSMYRYLVKYARWYQYPLLWLTAILLVIGVIPAILFTPRSSAMLLD